MTFCPLIKKKCIGAKCAWHTTIRGTNPNTGAEVDGPGCVVSFLPMLLIENSQQQRATGAATESFRNEMVKACLLYTSPSPRDRTRSRMPSSA